MAAKKSPQDKLAAIRAQISKLQADELALSQAIASGNLVSNVKVGDTVQFSYGRDTATTKRATLSGLVLGIKDTKLKVQAGEGFDVNIYTIDASAVRVPGEERTAPADQTVSETPEAGQAVAATPTAAEAAHEAAVAEAVDTPAATIDPAATAADPMAGV